MAKPKVAINGFGRIGRLSLRAMLQKYAKDIEVVARLCQDDRGGFNRIMPVAPHIGVRHVDVLDGLEVLHADHAADPPGVDDVLQHAEVGRVAEHVADADNRGAGLRAAMGLDSTLRSDPRFDVLLKRLGLDK